MVHVPKLFGELMIQFIGQNQWDKRILDIKRTHCPRPSKCIEPSRKVKIEKIPPNTPHPAAGQYGLFAAQTIHPGEHVLDYVGFVTTEEFAEESDYIAQLAPNVLINAAKMGNEARFINDFHGTGSMPNVRFQNYVDDNGETRLGVFAVKRKIKKGDELLITYGWGFSLG
mmetsp:Transcript_84824/g.226348  ORF Transcript_84824/g.226348 Transcript_84824/m.226348 type:complete len:170 (+) Transcript_84824:75-584(+)